MTESYADIDDRIVTPGRYDGARLECPAASLALGGGHARDQEVLTILGHQDLMGLPGRSHYPSSGSPRAGDLAACHARPVRRGMGGRLDWVGARGCGARQGIGERCLLG